MAARAAVLDWADTAAANPCVPAGGGGVFHYGGKEHKAVAAEAGAGFDTCTKVVGLVMAVGDECGVPKTQLVRSLRSQP